MWKQLLVTFSLAFASASAGYIRADGRPVVDVPQGTIVGLNETRGSISLYTFRGIPFAEPPTDELRFKLPVQAGPWTGDLDASENPQRCTQFGIGREDCLYLNVYTPEYAIDTVLTEPLPVMVWIFGGAWVLGSIAAYDGVEEFVDQGVIVVLVQYRVGVLGFLSTEDDEAPGNLGLWDQNMGLKWVNSNIANFGGDPNRVTLFGESAGSASTHYQMLSTQSQGLFQQAIMQSGNTFAAWALGRDFYENTVEIAEHFDCPTNTTADMIACLQGVNHRTLSLQMSFDWNFTPLELAPRIDGNFIPDHPANTVKNGLYTPVPTMMGVTLDEGSLVSGEMYALPGVIPELLSNFSYCAPTILFLYEDEGWDTTPYQVFGRYLGHNNITDDDADDLTLLFTHYLFHIPFDQVVEIHSGSVPTYIYQLNYRANASLINIFETLGLDLEAADEWVCHADDLPHLFGFYAEEDKHISQKMIKMWADYAKTGNPTPDGALGITWPVASPTNMQYLAIDDSLTIEPYSRQADKDFYESLPLRINQILSG